MGAQKPRIEFLLDDPQHPGRYQVPGYLSAFQGDQPRLGLWVPGGQGETVQATLQLYDRKGFEETRQVIGQNQDGSDILAPVSTVYRTVTLTRQSNKKTDARYNFYIQRNQSPPDAVKLGMLYDAANPDPTLMVSKQSGSLKGEVYLSFAHNPGSWCGTSTRSDSGWDSFVSVRTPVSRPWVEWKSDTLVEDNSQGHTVRSAKASDSDKEAGSKPVAINYDGPTYVGIDQPRDITFDYFDQHSYDRNGRYIYPARLRYSLSRDNVTIEPLSKTVDGLLEISSYCVWNLKIRVNATSEPPDNDPRTIVKVYLVLSDNTEHLVDTFPVSVFNAGMAVDYNRDGTIVFDDPITKTGPDHVPDGKTFAFWLNDDFDEEHLDADDNVLEQDDTDGSERNIYVDELSGERRWKTDGDFDLPTCERDLEDYARLHIQTAARGVPTFKGLKYKLYFTAGRDANGKQTTPEIKVFESARLEGDELYLKDNQAASDQLTAPFAGAVTLAYDSNGLPDLSKAMDITSHLPESGRLAPFLFEGIHGGQCKLTLAVTKDGVLLGRYRIPMELKDIKEFFEQYTVGDDDAEAPVTDCPNGDCAPSDAPFRYSAPDTNEEKDYVLYVHGWRMYDWEKTAWAATVYKRLYWLGYKGRLGLFRWPCGQGLEWDLISGAWAGSRYNNSEYSAWRSGAGLKNVISSLKQKGYRIHLFGHSQGAVVSGEALREIAAEGGRAVVNTYLVAQGAAPAGLWDNSKDLTQDGTPAVALYTYPGHEKITKRQSDDPLGFFPAPDLPTPGDGYHSYFEDVHLACGRMYNFYNKYDYAVGEHVNIGTQDNPKFKGGWWRIAQHQKPPLQGPDIVFKQGYQSDGVHFAKDASGIGDTFKYPDSMSQFWITNRPDGTPPKRDDIFQVFSYSAQSYSGAIGAQEGTIANFFSNHDLNDLFGFKNDKKEAVKHIYHSGEFRNFLANKGHSRRAFWFRFLKDLYQSASTPRQ